MSPRGSRGLWGGHMSWLSWISGGARHFGRSHRQERQKRVKGGAGETNRRSFPPPALLARHGYAERYYNTRSSIDASRARGPLPRRRSEGTAPSRSGAEVSLALPVRDHTVKVLIPDLTMKPNELWRQHRPQRAEHDLVLLQLVERLS